MIERLTGGNASFVGGQRSNKAQEVMERLTGMLNMD